MALTQKLSNEAVNAQADAVVKLLDAGYLRIFSGEQPATADTTLGAQVLLAELRFGTPAFGAPSSGVATANAIAADTSANATGTAAWCRVLKSDGTSVLFDGSVGTGTHNLVVSNVDIEAGGTVSASAFTFTARK